MADQARIKAGDVFAARRELPDDEAEWPMFIEWRARSRGALDLPYLEWLDHIGAEEILGIVQRVNEELEASPEAGASSA